MASRLQLHELLCNILGNRNVYFQPPESVKMHYPAIVYKQDSVKKQHADNSPYTLEHRYKVTFITDDPDSTIPDILHRLRKCYSDRIYSYDNLYHYVYLIYF